MTTESPPPTLSRTKSEQPHMKPREPTATANAEGGQENYLEGLNLFLLMVGIFLCIFLFALDQLILTTAIPRIVSQFDSLAEISWIPNAYFMTMAGFMIVYGQIINLVPLKFALVASIFIFEVGSLLCAVANNMHFLLFGRGVAGIGAGGLWVCALAAIVQVAPLEKRPVLMGTVGVTFSVSSLIGPLIGGVLTQHATWRWCFFINLPFGGFAAALIFFFLPNYPPPPRPANRQGWKALLAVDYVGAILAFGATVTFLYPLVEGGDVYAWDSPIIIALFVTSGVLLALFVVWSWYRGPEAMLQLRLFQNRSVIGASLALAFIWMSMMLGTVYLTTWYQAVKGHSPTRSGIDLLPFELVLSLVALLVAVVIGKIDRYWHVIVLAPLVGAVASGLEFTINEHTSEGRLVGYQMLWGSGIGAVVQLPIIAVQAEYRENIVDTRYAISLITFVGFIGRMVGIAIGGTLFINKLAKYLPIYAPDAPFDLVLHSVDAIWKLPPEQRTGVIHAYVLSLRFIFILGVPTALLASLSALLIRNRKLSPASDNEGVPPELKS